MDDAECEAMSQRVTDLKNDIHGHLRTHSEQMTQQGAQMVEHHSLLVKHIEHFQKHEKEEVIRHTQNIKSQDALIESMDNLSTSVSGVIEVYTTVNSLGKFLKWISGIVVILAGTWAYFHK